VFEAMMPTIDEVLADSAAGRAVVEMAREQGGDPEQVRRAIAAVVPELARHLERNTLSRGGLANFVSAVGEPQHGARLGAADLAGDSAVSNDGNAILQHIVGGKDASRAIAAQAARASGLSETLIKMLLPFIASMLMSALQRYLQGGLGDILKRLPQGSGQSQPDEGDDRPMQRRRDRGDSTDDRGGGYGRGFELPQQGPIDGIPDRGSRAPMDVPQAPPDRPRADTPWQTPSAPSPSSPGSIPQQVPPSWPGDSPGSTGRSPFDDISDILRRGAGPKVDGQPLQRSVRDLIGGVLGFSSRGAISWILRLIFVRFGWGILKRLLGWR
jgi:hypothetical protein